MAYRANVTDKQQDDIESAANDSGIPVYVERDGAGVKKILPAMDLQAQSTSGSPNDAVAIVSRAHMMIGSHNDKPGRFETPGRA